MNIRSVKIGFSSTLVIFPFFHFSMASGSHTEDFEVSVEDDKVSVRSSSRVGDSDFGVNAKRRSTKRGESGRKWEKVEKVEAVAVSYSELM